jgi:SPX domain protein involved in polyphosphate accumulation
MPQRSAFEKQYTPLLIPEWKRQFLDYHSLRADFHHLMNKDKQIKRQTSVWARVLTAPGRLGFQKSGEEHHYSNNESEFLKALDEEIARVNEFYCRKEEELSHRHDLIIEQDKTRV